MANVDVRATGPSAGHQRSTIAAERDACAQLRDQIAALEHKLSDALIAAFPDPGPAPTAATAIAAGPRVLGLGELEDVRDALVQRLADARAQARLRADRRQASWLLLERMLLEPGRHKFVRVSQRDLGEGGCGAWQVRPRLGLIGMLMGWWQVKLSSGCPLAA
jgi:hypothetical protein